MDDIVRPVLALGMVLGLIGSSVTGRTRKCWWNQAPARVGKDGLEFATADSEEKVESIVESMADFVEDDEGDNLS